MVLDVTRRRLEERMASVGRPSVGLVLGSGAARGIAHIGVIGILEEHQIPIDVMAGCSIGALIGGMYATGMDIDHIIRLTERLSKLKLITLGDLTISRQGLIAGERIEKFLKNLLGNITFSELKRPIAICATDIITGEEVVLEEGSLIDAIRASISIPGLFIPAEIGWRKLVDGGVVNPVPVNYLKDVGVDIVIAVNVIPRVERKHIENITTVDVLLNAFDIMENRIFELQRGYADVLITPNVDMISGIEFWRAKEIIELGEAAALKVVDLIKRIMGERMI